MNHKPVVVATLAPFFVACVSACSSTPPLTADDAVFDGLDRAEVRETLALQADLLDSQPVEDRAQIAQDSALELGACRALWEFLQTSDATGSAPDTLVLPHLSDQALAAGQADPREDRHPYSVNFDWIGVTDREAMISFLTAPATCQWVPVDADATASNIHDLAIAAFGDDRPLP